MKSSRRPFDLGRQGKERGEALCVGSVAFHRQGAFGLEPIERLAAIYRRSERRRCAGKNNIRLVDAAACDRDSALRQSGKKRLRTDAKADADIETPSPRRVDHCPERADISVKSLSPG